MHQSKEILGLLYRQFYHHTDQETVLQLYVSIVQPHMEYAAPVWDPHVRKVQDLLETIQKFAYKMITKNWDKGYDELLYMTNLPSLINTVEFLSIYSKDYLLLATVAWAQYVQLTARSKARFTAQFKLDSQLNHNFEA